MVKTVRETEKMIGEVDYELTEKQISGRNFSRSLYIIEDVKKGDQINLNNVRSIRPGYGLHPKHLENILGNKFNADFEKGYL